MRTGAVSGKTPMYFLVGMSRHHKSHTSYVDTNLWHQNATTILHPILQRNKEGKDRDLNYIHTYLFEYIYRNIFLRKVPDHHDIHL